MVGVMNNNDEKKKNKISADIYKSKMEFGKLGLHLIVDIWNISPIHKFYLTDRIFAEDLAIQIVNKAEMTPVGPFQFHPFPLRFPTLLSNQKNNQEASHLPPSSSPLCRLLRDDDSRMTVISDDDDDCGPSSSSQILLETSEGGYSAFQMLAESHVSPSQLSFDKCFES